MDTRGTRRCNDEVVESFPGFPARRSSVNPSPSELTPVTPSPQHTIPFPPVPEDPHDVPPHLEIPTPRSTTPQGQERNPFDNADSPSLASALAMLAKSIRSQDTSDSTSSSRAKTREPDTFDGTDPKKLRSFVVQCQLNFNERPRAFRTDQAKVNYALSYLKGMALDWFEPDILNEADDDNRPLWKDSYEDFLTELRQNFGPHDPVGDAEAKIEHLQMRDSNRVARYIVEFNQLASQVRGWGDGALKHQFYKGLPSRIKDEIARVGKPPTLSQLRVLAQSIDSHYWERRNEVNRESNSSKSNSDKDKSNKTKSTDSEKSQNKSSSTNNKSSGNNKSSNTTSSQTPNLEGKLGKDGKLTPEERKRRLDNNLCLFCGGAGHTARDCTKTGSSASRAKGRAATVEESSPTSSDTSPSTSESKN